MVESNNVVVGVIGGAGVAATNKLTELLENRYTKEGAFRDCHHPEMIIFQATKAPSRSMYLEGKGESFIDDYVSIANKLKNCGADTLCMCCNTAHYAIDVIKEAVQIPFINLIEEVVKEVKSRGKQKIGLVASDGCLMGKVYEKYFEEIYPEAEIIYPDKEIQKLVTKGICNIKNTNRFKDSNDIERPCNIFTEIHDYLISEGSQIVIMGCTDIRVDYIPPVDTIDSLEVLADRIYNLTKKI